MQLKNEEVDQLFIQNVTEVGNNLSVRDETMTKMPYSLNHLVVIKSNHL